jgi:acyl-coenzyme A synthetase/AMP-(fatty) acid ligase
VPIEGPRLAEPFPLAEVLSAGLDADPDGAAVITLQETPSWRELDARSTNVAAGYLALGVSQGDRVATLLPTHPALMVHHLACLKAGLVSTPLNYRYMSPEIDHALRVSRPSLLVHHVERDADLASCDELAEVPRGTLRYGGSGAGGGGAPPFDELMARAADGVTLPSIRSDAPLFVFFTSGSTGPAKGVTHTVGTIGWMIADLVASLEMSRSDVVLTATSHSHLGGVSMGLTAFATGVPLAMSPTSDGAEVFPLIRTSRPTVTCLFPSLLSALVGDEEATREAFASFRYMGSAGDKAPAELERRFAELAGYDMVELYGMTEAMALTLTPPGGPNKRGSVGCAGAGVALSVRDEDGAEVEAGEVGRLWIRTKGVTSGYWDHPEATAEVFEDGWFDTGDLVRVDADGYAWFAGRRKQIIVHDGSNIAPQEVEAALLEHPAVARAGVVGVRDPLHGEDVWAFVTIRPGVESPSMRELKAFAAERVGYRAPEVVEVVDRMPVTAVGKTDRTALTAMVAARLDDEPGAPGQLPS